MADGARLADALVTWQTEVAVSRRILAEHRLDDTGTFWGQPVSLRWVVLHVIEEYARHNGHADLLQERIDGSTGV